MNVTFHALTGLAMAAVVSRRLKADGSSRLFTPQDSPWLVAAFAVGILLHGLLDYAPHAYPIISAVDVLVSLTLFLLTLRMTRRRYRLLLVACYVGCIFPDLVDLGPAIVNKRLGWSLPVVKIFPWHWPKYSGSIYDGTRGTESFLYHLVVVGGSLILLYAYRRRLFRAVGHVHVGCRS